MIMMLLLVLNLSLIIFDWLYGFSWIREFLHSHVPDFNSFYSEKIHRNFLEIDLAFISIFLVEFLFSWSIAVLQRRHSRWFFYPISHWYDILGCIPLNAFRFVRILRIYSIVIRLHKLGFVNLKNTYFYRKFEKHYDILVEEISDRVVVNVLTGMQGEIREGGQVLDRVILDILKPKKELIAEWVSHRIRTGVGMHYGTRKDDLRKYIDHVIEDAVNSSVDVSRLDRIPVMGGVITTTIKQTISDVVFGAVETVLTDVSSDKNKALVGEVTEFLFDSIAYEEQDNKLKQIVEEMLIESIEVVKEQVNVKQWKLKQVVSEETGQESGADNTAFDNTQ
jgi:hypothetical protein